MLDVILADPVLTAMIIVGVSLVAYSLAADWLKAMPAPARDRRP